MGQTLGTVRAEAQELAQDDGANQGLTTAIANKLVNRAYLMMPDIIPEQFITSTTFAAAASKTTVWTPTASGAIGGVRRILSVGISDAGNLVKTDLNYIRYLQNVEAGSGTPTRYAVLRDMTNTGSDLRFTHYFYKIPSSTFTAEVYYEWTPTEMSADADQLRLTPVQCRWVSHMVAVKMAMLVGDDDLYKKLLADLPEVVGTSREVRRWLVKPRVTAEQGAA